MSQPQIQPEVEHPPIQIIITLKNNRAEINTSVKADHTQVIDWLLHVIMVLHMAALRSQPREDAPKIVPVDEVMMKRLLG